MAAIRFIWDERKNAINKREHGVSFEEGQTVFSDDNALFMHDPDHSEDEDRFLLWDSARLPDCLLYVIATEKKMILSV
jgi:uncharacterized DUF497 family protein